MTKSETYEERVKRVFGTRDFGSFADQPTTAQRIARTLSYADIARDDAHARARAMLQTRDSLRAALEASNRSETFAGQDPPDTAMGEARGVFGLIARALEAMGEGEALEGYYDSAQWPQD